MLQTHHPHGAANRLYYACFYAVTALLLSRDLASAKHSGILALFNQHLVKPGHVAVEWGKFYARLFENRMESDYADGVSVDAQELQADMDRAEQFIQTLEKQIPHLA